MPQPTTTILHASAVALAGRGLLILGPSGSGKSALSLALMATGCGLVSDDRTVVTCQGAALIADAPPRIRGMIEARHIGLLAAEAVGPVPLAGAVDLAGPRAARLPERRWLTVLGLAIPLLPAQFSPELAPALRQYLTGGFSTAADGPG